MFWSSSSWALGNGEMIPNLVLQVCFLYSMHNITLHTIRNQLSGHFISLSFIPCISADKATYEPFISFWLPLFAIYVLPGQVPTTPNRLPPEFSTCLSGVPQYTNDTIKSTRSPAPQDRPSSHGLVLNLAEESCESPPNDTTHLTKRFASLPVDHVVHHDVCGAYTTYLHYHCYVCNEFDFDICLACFGVQIWCYVLKAPLGEEGIDRSRPR